MDRRRLLLVALLLCASCDRPAIEASDSLVEATDLPSAKQLSQEAIEINQAFGGAEGFGDHFLSYQLAADDRLDVIYTYRPDDDVRGRESFKLAAKVADDARRALWRLRPARLDGVNTDVRPIGCTSQSPHDLGDMAVGFIAPNEDFGIFTLPYPGSCNNAAARGARDVVREVLESFPHSEVAAAYFRAEAADEAR